MWIFDLYRSTYRMKEKKQKKRKKKLKQMRHLAIQHKTHFILFASASCWPNQMARMTYFDCLSCREISQLQAIVTTFAPKYFSILVEVDRFCFRFEANPHSVMWPELLLATPTHNDLYENLAWLLNRTDGVELDVFSINNHSYTISAWNSKCWQWHRRFPAPFFCCYCPKAKNRQLRQEISQGWEYMHMYF